MRLTNAIREDILNNALSFKFKKEDREASRNSITKRESELAREIYDLIMGEHGKKFDEFEFQDALQYDHYFSIRVSLSNGYQSHLCTNSSFNDLDKKKYYSYYQKLMTNDRFSPYKLKGDLEERVRKFVDDRENHGKEYSEASAKLKAFLNSFTTIGQLQKQWAEGEPFYRKWLVEPKRSILPAVVVSEINQVFGVPLPEELEVGEPIEY
jgi:hypothetical protein